MEDLEKLAKSILEQGYLMSLATVDGGGVWVSDVVFVSDGLNLYWLSKLDTRHSKAILENPQVAATVTISNEGESNVGLQIAGLAEKMDIEDLGVATKHAVRRKKNPPSEGEKLVKEGESWYKLTPAKVEIIYEPKWGYTKKVLEFKK